MKYFVTHTTGTWIEAETEEIAQAELCRLIQENIEPSHCCIDGEDDSNVSDESEETTEGKGD